MARYRSRNAGRGAGTFLDVTVVYYDDGWMVNWETKHFIDHRYWAELPGNPEKESKK